MESHLCGKKIIVIKQESCLVASVIETLPIGVKQKTQTICGTPQMCEVTPRACRLVFPQVVPICTNQRPSGIRTDLYTHSLTHSSRSRFLPCLAGMVIIVTERLRNTLFKVCLNDSGIVMLAREVQPAKAPPPM